MANAREYKSDVFSMLMQYKEYALEVYNMLNGTDYEDPEMVEIITLENGISLTVRNDAAYIIDYELTISEHQSSYCPNMPLRNVIYFANIIQKLTKKKNIFGRSLIKIPLPRFVVFYNGREMRPEVEIQKLSDAFEKEADEPEIELICTIYNINPENNVSLLKNCQVLTQYNHLIEKVREYDILEGNITDAVSKAIEYCIRNHILENFLREHRTEVLHVFTVDGTFERRTELMQMEMDEVKEERDAMAKQNEILTQQLDTLTQQFDAQAKQNDTLMQQLDAQAKQNDTLMQQLDAQAKQNAFLAQQIEELKQSLKAAKDL